ncbi:unnamed protein product [Phytophthora lilii]|uniref:Unnamed protein product n=1 Tax=Phytophthora lilii TaxID=2077276 RepID=A0A9W6XI54_9STRA|nr:unnamed protein product [Phytophthora lilii]
MSSGFSYPQPTFQSSIYNPAFFLTLDASGYLTFDYAQTLYLSKDDYRLSYLSGISPGTATSGIAIVPDLNKAISGLGALGCSSLSCSGNLTLSGASSVLSLTGASSYVNATAYKQGGTQYDLSLVQYLSGVSFGSATTSKFLLCDSDRNISNLNTVSASTISCTSMSVDTFYCSNFYHAGNLYDVSQFLTSVPSSLSLTTLSTSENINCSGVINGFLAYGNQSAITTVGSLTELGINSTPTNEYLSIIGSGSDYLDGSYTRMMTLTGSNATPVKFQIEVSNGSTGTASNATWIGNYTNNDLRFGTNNGKSMILTTTGRLGVNTTTPSAPLHIVGSNTYVFGAGGLTVYRLRTDSGSTESALGPISYSVAGIFGGYIACTAMAMTSDRRLKRNIQPCPIDRIKRLYDDCEVKLYDWIESEGRPNQEVGLISQDLVKAHLTDLTSVFYRDDIQEGQDPVLEPAKQQLNVDYSRISAYNMRMIQHLMSEIEDLKRQIDELRSTISE